MNRRSSSFFAQFAFAGVVTMPLAQAAVVFTDDFENPDVTVAQSLGNTNGTVPAGWVGATEGFGADRRGVVDEAAGAFADPTGEQAFAFRYTNSGLTSAAGVIGSVTAGETITVSVDVVADGGATPYLFELVAFGPGVARNDVRGSFTNFTLLASLSGDASGDGAYTTVDFDFTPDAVDDAAVIGQDIGIRFIGATASASIDNVSIDITAVAVPEPSSLILVGLSSLALLGRRRRS